MISDSGTLLPIRGHGRFCSVGCRRGVVFGVLWRCGVSKGVFEGLGLVPRTSRARVGVEGGSAGGHKRDVSCGHSFSRLITR